MRIRLFGSDTAVRDYFPLLRWMIFTGVTVFGFALAWYYGLFQLMMAQDRSGLCGRMGSSLAIACGCRSRIAASSSSCCLDPEAAVIHLSFRTSGSQKTLRWRKADSNPRSRLSRAAQIRQGVRKAWGPDWRRPGASSYVVAASICELDPTSRDQILPASSANISTMPSKPTVRCRFEKVCTAPMPAGALTRT